MNRRVPVLLIFSYALCVSASARADDSNIVGITLFRTDVTAKEDATVEVREEISVNNATSFYKYGFIRNLPIGSEDRWDRRYVGEYKRDNGIRVSILEVTEDGHPVNYEQGSGYGYSQLRIGEKDVPLDSGDHRFVIRYTVDSALTLGAARDTLYWNSNGHERNAPIAEAILAVHLPAGISPERVEVEPRVAGRGVSYPRRPETTLDRIDDPSATITYRATNVGPRQSLSLAVTWPAGFIHQSKLHVLGPDQWLFAGPALLFLYYLIAWFWIGPEPKPGTVVTRYDPPENLSAAGARYIASGVSDGRSFAAVIAELAVRGCLRVEPSDGKYKLSRLMGDRAREAQLAPEEKRVLAMLFEDGPVIELSSAMDQRNTAQNGRYVFHIHEELQKQLAGKYFTRHTGIIALGVLATFASAVVLAAMAHGRDTTAAVFFTMWFLFCGLILGLMFELAFASAWKTAVRAGAGWTKLLPGTAAIAVFGAVMIFMLTKLAEGVSLSFVLMLVSYLFINLGWGPRLKRKTLLGRQTIDQIEGFRLFLQKVEQDQLNRINPSDESLERSGNDLNRFLSYAIALEVKEAWGDQLAQTFSTLTVTVEG
jgi:predicted membrane protein DUF2207